VGSSLYVVSTTSISVYVWGGGIFDEQKSRNRVSDERLVACGI
jgi:hypothetical protein